MNGTAVILIVLVILAIVSGFFLLAELEDKYLNQEEEDDGLQ